MGLGTTRKIAKDSGGFTVIEIVVAAAIIVLIGVVVTKFWINTSEAFILENNTAVLKQQSERSMEIMAERIRRANAASIGLSNGNSTMDFVDTADGSDIQYTLTPLAPVAPAWGEITQSINAVPNAIAGYAQALQFDVTGTGLVTINATFIIGSGRTRKTLTMQCNVAARN